jgi:hypothetical protein
VEDAGAPVLKMKRYITVADQMRDGGENDLAAWTETLSSRLARGPDNAATLPSLELVRWVDGGKRGARRSGRSPWRATGLLLR